MTIPDYVAKTTLQSGVPLVVEDAGVIAKLALLVKSGGPDRTEARVTSTRRFTLYVLALEGDNYYVGITGLEPWTKRIEQHSQGKGAHWTRLHKPVRVIESVDLGSVSRHDALAEENAVTLRFIQKYGVDHVRGGQVIHDSPVLATAANRWVKDNLRNAA